MTNPDLIAELISQADRLMEEYANCDAYWIVLTESVESINCRVEKLVGVKI